MLQCLIPCFICNKVLSLWAQFLSQNEVQSSRQNIGAMFPEGNCDESELKEQISQSEMCYR